LRFKWWNDLDVDNLTIKHVPLRWENEKEKPVWLKEALRIASNRGLKNVSNNQQCHS